MTVPIIPNPSPELIAFLTDWLDWATSDAPDDRYSSSYGLCYCSEDWVDDHEEQYPDLAYSALSLELTRHFSANASCGSYPFGEAAYDQCAATNTQHLDPNRRAWVRAQLAAAGVACSSVKPTSNPTGASS